MNNHKFTIQSLSATRADWVRKKMIEDWGAEIIVVHGEVFHPAELPGFVAELDGEAVGLLTYRIEAGECEIMTLNAWQPGMGVGSALVEAARQAARWAGCRRLFLVTTNNNLHALRFYQKRDFFISAVRIDAIRASRLLKPGIPLVDDDGLPIRDEIELELFL
jgi:ribosomal protein S18 acetylase RimI-like enzyme